MRPEPNNEIDLLLRQLSRQNGVSVSQIDEQHLDADELNSYVANALPAKARARYMQHLVDCSSCRKMVAQLSSAEGPVAVQQPSTVIEPSGLKSFLASLLSPMVLRYAVPALGVILITVVGIVMLRQEQQEGANTSVAQIPNTDQTKSVPDSLRESTTQTPPAQREQAPRAGVMADAPAAPPPPKPVPAEEAEQQPKAETKAGPPADQPAGATDAVQPINTEEAKISRPKKEADKDVVAKEKQQQREDESASAPSVAAAPGNKAPEPQGGKSGETAGTGTGGVANAPTSRQEVSRARKGDFNASTLSTAERRNVAGRDFVKRGDVWIDLGYDSSQAITVFSRGTEQYRTLIANEPAIQTIAENLKSEFIVVWKGRAYRIR